ncbi:hypothetical protein F5Y11DRAFT_349724 [Daldinia sp. FL1419]|nr:hypothetical protein F5Y11DRAFT_349724 [Daldinia sp. FL1419]
MPKAIYLPKSELIRMNSIKTSNKPQLSIPLDWPGWEVFKQAFERIQLDDDRLARQVHE